MSAYLVTMHWSPPLGVSLRDLRRQRYRSLVRASEAAVELAERLGMPVRGLSQGSLSEYERGASTPNIDAVRVLAKVYGVTITDIAPELPDVPTSESP